VIQDPSIERCILGAIPLNPIAFDEVVDAGVRPEDFSLDSHRKIFRAETELMGSAGQVDVTALCHTLATVGCLESIGGDIYVASLLDGVPDRGSIQYHIDRLLELSRRRQIIETCNATVGRLQDDADSATESNDLAARLTEIIAGIEDPQADGVLRCSDVALAEWERENLRTSELIGLPSGLRSLDRLTAGIRDGEYWIFGARPSQGKSAEACQIVRANCELGNAVHIFSLEMGKTEILQRIWAAISGVPFGRIHNGRCDSTDTARVRGAAMEVARWPLMITDKTLAVERIVTRAKASIRRFNTKLIVVDFLQNVPHNERDPRLGMNRVSDALRVLARDTHVPVVAFSQLRRGADPTARPTMFDLRESGQLEQDAHLIALIHRPVDESNQPTGEDLLSIAKNRHGRTGDLAVRFNANTMSFDERITDGDENAN
jgi:replicative DNA helicase